MRAVVSSFLVVVSIKKGRLQLHSVDLMPLNDLTSKQMSSMRNIVI